MIYNIQGSSRDILTASWSCWCDIQIGVCHANICVSEKDQKVQNQMLTYKICCKWRGLHHNWNDCMSWIWIYPIKQIH